MKKFFYIFLLLLGTAAFWACSETEEENTEYVNWPSRNETFMRDTLAFAVRQVAAAKAQWGEDWEANCDWRVYPSYCVAAGGVATWEDSIAVRVIERGKGSGCPLYTDSVRVTYAGRLMPTDTYPTGYLFDHSGFGNRVEEVMAPSFESPAKFAVSNLVEGFTTALMQMHVGDYWRVFIPANMAYGESGSSSIPGSSTLVFDMRLKSYKRR